MTTEGPVFQYIIKFLCRTHVDLLKLDAFRDEITNYLKKGINKRAIAKLIECSPSTLYKWLKRRRIHTN